MIWLTLGVVWAGVVADSHDAIESGNADQAVAVIEQSLASSQGSSGLYANLSHAYFVNDDLPRAIGAMRKASTLAPRSSAVHHDLARMRSLAKGPTTPAEPAVSWTKMLTPGEAGLLSCGLLLFASVWLFRRRERPDLLVTGSFVGCLLLVLYVLWGVAETLAQPVAVVVDHPATLRDSPAMSAGLRHELEPGSEVRVEQTYAGFSLIVDGRGRRGWAANSALWILSN